MSQKPNESWNEVFQNFKNEFTKATSDKEITIQELKTLREEYEKSEKLIITQETKAQIKEFFTSVAKTMLTWWWFPILNWEKDFIFLESIWYSKQSVDSMREKYNKAWNKWVIFDYSWELSFKSSVWTGGRWFLTRTWVIILNEQRLLNTKNALDSAETKTITRFKEGDKNVAELLSKLDEYPLKEEDIDKINLNNFKLYLNNFIPYLKWDGVKFTLKWKDNDWIEFIFQINTSNNITKWIYIWADWTRAEWNFKDGKPFNFKRFNNWVLTWIWENWIQRDPTQEEINNGSKNPEMPEARPTAPWTAPTAPAAPWTAPTAPWTAPANRYDLSKKQPTLDENLKWKNYEVDVKTILNVRNEKWDKIWSKNKWEQVTLTWNKKEANWITFVEINKNKYVALNYLKEISIQQQATVINPTLPVTQKAPKKPDQKESIIDKSWDLSQEIISQIESWKKVVVADYKVTWRNEHMVDMDTPGHKYDREKWTYYTESVYENDFELYKKDGKYVLEMNWSWFPDKKLTFDKVPTKEELKKKIDEMSKKYMEGDSRKYELNFNF